ncbi:MAG: hypothetical protein LH481_15030 [Burkholderiales bacterium]|nr:hypothetical protein [Burkholderiales bacterium]
MLIMLAGKIGATVVPHPPVCIVSAPPTKLTDTACADVHATPLTTVTLGA